MLGSFEEAEDVVQDVLLRAWRARDTYAGDAPLAHWLMRIATNACLNALTRGRPRALPQLDRDPARRRSMELEAATWVTPAPDARLFPDPARARGGARAGGAGVHRPACSGCRRSSARCCCSRTWSAGRPRRSPSALELTVVVGEQRASPRARDGRRRARAAPTEDPPPEVLAAYLRSWETRDLDSLVALLRKDVVFAMPPHATWFRGAAAVRAFLQTPRFGAFWTRGLRVTLTRANGLPALVFYAAARATTPTACIRSS